MSGTSRVLCIAVMLLLGVACARGRCDYSMILSTYRQLIFAELQSLVNRIVRSIYGITEQFVCLSKDQQRDSTAAVVSRMGELIKMYCRKTSMASRHNATSCKTSRKKKGKRKWQNKIIQMLVNCWQKLQSVHSYMAHQTHREG